MKDLISLLFVATLALLSSIAQAESLKLKVTSVPLPGATGPVSLDYIAIDRRSGQVWIPAGGTGSVDVYDSGTGEMHRIEGFKTAERERNGKKQLIGPSSVSLSDTTAYVGNRATSEICAIDKETLKLGNCTTLDFPPDGVQYVGVTREVWITTPKDKSITILDADLKPKGKKIVLAGAPEGYAIDNHGDFFTNLEDKDQSLKIDVQTRKIKTTFNPECGEAGPRGLVAARIDLASGKNLGVVTDMPIVACTDHVVVPSGSHKDSQQFATGAGVDNIDFTAKHLYVASGATSKLYVLEVDNRGNLVEIANADTADGVRSVVADAQGHAYMPDPAHGRLLIADSPQ